MCTKFGDSVHWWIIEVTYCMTLEVYSIYHIFPLLLLLVSSRKKNCMLCIFLNFLTMLRLWKLNLQIFQVSFRTLQMCTKYGNSSFCWVIQLTGKRDPLKQMVYYIFFLLPYLDFFSRKLFYTKSCCASL